MSLEETANSSDQLNWFKSSYSGGAGGECVEVASCTHGIHVRDSKDTVRTGLVVGPGAWATFVGYAVGETG
ncbi:DUF397 domain-containing protein [Streptomyces sp. NBC_00377]|uniref:DUF397 domain-containing protein n=1 Tax=unclassified Streptomyces TaxID=2593676 RepID=UPI002E23CB7B|nr:MULTISPECIES: DUF397 domain-containing protein [unclassified Streptomyces]